MNSKRLILTAFLGGFLACGALQFASIRVVAEARADVAGLNAYQLENDPAFRQAVKNVVEQSCKTDLRFSDDRQNIRTWHYCNPGSRYAP